MDISEKLKSADTKDALIFALIGILEDQEDKINILIQKLEDLEYEIKGPDPIK